MFVLAIFLSIIVVALTPLIIWVLNYSKYACLKNVPGPTPLPIIGNANEVGKTTVDLLQSFLKLQNKYGSFYKLWLGSRLHLMISKPEYLDQLLNSNIHLSKSDGYDLFRPWLGDSLLVTTETAFGTSIQAQFKGNPKYVEAVTGFLEIFTLRFFSGWLRNPIIFRFSDQYKKYKEYLKILHNFTNGIVKERQVEFRNIKKNHEKVRDDGIKRKAALLDMLLQATYNGEPLSNEDIRAEVDTFMFEGHDTASAAIGYTLYAICQNNEIQNKVYDELMDVFGQDSKCEITISQINELKYLDIVVKEALRYYSPVPLIERMLENDWTIDEITVPKGTNISIFIYGMNHMPDVFPEPDRFDPERFLPEKQNTRHTYSFIPFSAGPRNCIGQRYALYEMKTCVIKFLLHFELIPDSDFVPEIGMCSVLKSKNGIKMKLKLRNKN